MDIMCEVNPEHMKNVRVGNGVTVLYLQISNDLYDCMESVLLWYEIFTKALKSHGFVVNSYARCILNSTIYSNQCTIGWYVDDNKVSHIEEYVNKRIIETISEHFGELTLSINKIQVTGNGHRVLSYWYSIAVNEVLRVGIHCII